MKLVKRKFSSRVNQLLPGQRRELSVLRLFLLVFKLSIILDGGILVLLVL